jgi:hypothetical protein
MVAAAVSGIPARAQQQSVATRAEPKKSALEGPATQHLARVDTVTSANQVVTGFLGPMACDDAGNLYFRRDHADAIHKLNQKGEEVALFQASTNTDKKLDGMGYFALALGGDLYQLTFPHELDRYVFVYKSDGTLKSRIKLNPGFAWLPHTLAVFPSGQMLVAGSEYDHDHTATMWPFTGIFGADGSLLKEVKLEDDSTLREMANSGDSRAVSPQHPPINRAVDLSQAEVAQDGNAYLMRWTDPAILYAISPGGEVVRRIKVDPGSAGYEPSKMHVVGSRIAVLFVDSQTQGNLIKIVDLEGRAIATYDEKKADAKQGGPLGNVFACYTLNPERLTFLGADDDRKL